MDDLISRQAAIDALDEIEAEVADGYGYQYAKWREYFVELPSAEPVRHGKWNIYYRMHSGDTFICDRCGSCFVAIQGADKMNFCPNCGAKMDGELEGKSKK